MVVLLLLIVMLSKIFFIISWCGPCKAIAPYVHQKVGETGIPLVKVNVDTAGEVSAKYNIKAMPTFLVIKGQWDNVVH